jgi:NH3-dependent NAD+ synthetase
MGHPIELSDIEAQAEHLVASIAKLPSCVVAFSGGVDSAVVAAAAYRALGDRAVAWTGKVLRFLCPIEMTQFELHAQSVFAMNSSKPARLRIPITSTMAPIAATTAKRPSIKPFETGPIKTVSL